MPLSDAEFDAILTDCTKLIEGDIVWQEDEDHSPSLEFKVEIATAGGWPLFMKGTYNPLVPTIQYKLGRNFAKKLRSSTTVECIHHPQFKEICFYEHLA